MSTQSLLQQTSLRKRGLGILGGALLGCVLLSGAQGTAAQPVSGDYVAIPPFIAENSGKPNVIVALDISGSMKTTAYRDVGAGNWKSGLHDDFNPATSYFGYFEGKQIDGTSKQYSYDTAKGFFYEDVNGDWDGNFLNWLTMRRIDVVRKVLVGGKVRDRAGETLGGQTWWVIEGQNEPVDYTFRKSYSASNALTPSQYPDGQEFTIAEGFLKPTANSGSFITPIGDKLEVGRVTMDWSVFQDNPADPTSPLLSDWVSISYENTYTNPVVVATGVSYNGGDPVIARVRNVTTSGFEMRLQEWDHKDGDHTTEDIVYLVAETGAHTVTASGGPNLEFAAGSVTTDKSATNQYETVNYGKTFTASPVVFHGVSTNAVTCDIAGGDDPDCHAVITRARNVGISTFDVGLQEQEDNYASDNSSNALNTPHPQEDLHWIAVKPGAATVGGVPFEIGKETGINNGWHTLTYTNPFPAVPLVALSAQTSNGDNTASVRYGNNVQTESAVDLRMDEETSADSETTHVDENVGYLAVPGSGYRLQIGVLAEPTGIIQSHANAMRFGLALYNYDHTKSPTNIYNGNKLDGGTLYPCYPDLSLPTASRTNYDICLPTHVKAPLDNIINVVEDHPLIWGTTPIAETLYEIYGYVRQNGAYYYLNGTETDHPGTYPSYKVNNTWDPYYYDEYSAKLPCVKTFVLHFNDGAPYEDWQTSNPATVHPSITTDGDASDGKNDMLDDMAYHLRKNDCRGDIAEHQEVISYYVYSALGESESNNGSTKRLREAAANGGFSDNDGDHGPDPAHPSNFISYVNTGGCTTNEWDDNADCSPDTFYFASDGAQLVTELNAAFESILRRASSGGAASVISASSSGEGAIYQGIFQPSMLDGAFEVKWTGDVHGVFVDDAGNLRDDGNGDKTLGSLTDDPLIDMCFDQADKVVRVKLSTSEAARPTTAQTTACSVSVFDKDVFDLEYIWSAGGKLSDLTDAQATSQRVYASSGAGRHILTGIDASGGNGLVETAEAVAFEAATFTNSNAGLLQAADATEATKIVNFVRGEDQTGYRSREIDNGKTYRMGDIIYSIPSVVGRPSEAFDILYQDSSYATFLNQYRQRRNVVYTGTNDGLFHAFNAGYFDPTQHKFLKAPPSKVQHELGSELWAYVPYNLLPHLKYTTRLDYGRQTGDHLYFTDLKPRVFDAKIFANDAKHPGGWGTVLVGGMRFGGGTITVDANPASPGTDIRTMRSAYFILDITDPEGPPTVMLEFTHADLGFTTSVPAPFVVNGSWYLLLGSGPDATLAGLGDGKSTQAGKVFLINLSTMVLETTFDGDGIMDLPDANSFVSDLVAVDFNLDYSADAVYFGTVSGTAAPWGGKLYRLRIANPATGAPRTPGSWDLMALYDAGKPITAKASFGIDRERNRWVFTGSGRFLTRSDSLDNSDNVYFGFKEPRDTNGSFKWTTIANNSKMGNVTNSVVEQGSGKLTGVTINPALPANATWEDLEKRMVQFSDSTNYQDGWYRNFTSGERIIGEATLLGSTLTHTSYEPSSNACEVEGSSRLYAIYYGTGTAGPRSIIGTGGNGPGGNATLEIAVDLGVAPALTPSLHTGSGYDDESDSKAFIQTSTGKTLVIEQRNEDPVRSGERSWRELE